MSQQTESFELAAPIAVSQAACQRAVSRLNWKLAESGPNRLLVKIGFGPWSNPARIEVLLWDWEAGSIVQLNGQIFQVGPIATRKLRSYMASLENSIRLEAKPAPSAG